MSLKMSLPSGLKIFITTMLYNSIPSLTTLQLLLLHNNIVHLNTFKTRLKLFAMHNILEYCSVVHALPMSTPPKYIQVYARITFIFNSVCN